MHGFTRGGKARFGTISNPGSGHARQVKGNWQHLRHKEGRNEFARVHGVPMDQAVSAHHRLIHGHRRSCIAAVTGSKVIHHPAERAPECPSPPPDVNNFAAAQLAAACQISLPAKAGGVVAPDGSRSFAAYLLKVSRREPARPWASTKGLIEPKLPKLP
jgi:hypothetical protein